MPVATLTSKGQLVVPKGIREYLHLHPGDRLDFIIRDDGDVVLRLVVTDVRELKGLLHKPGRQPVPIMAMQNVIRTRVGRSQP